jgi:hypothetical protein|tara:strand:- start:98 stop:385 length:288 start_codon:yes stop_codon:yes gene_type:complete
MGGWRLYLGVASLRREFIQQHNQKLNSKLGSLRATRHNSPLEYSLFGYVKYSIRVHTRGKRLVRDKVSDTRAFAFESSLSPQQCAYIQHLKGALI